jgi:PPP family 3-phenylpropionic acid transporter
VSRGGVRDAVAVQGLFVAFGVAVAAFFPFLTLYLDGRGLSPDEIGLVVAVIATARFVTNPLWGHVADTRIGRLTALRLGALGVAVCAFAMNAVHGVLPLAAMGFLLAVWQVATGPNLDAIALAYLGDGGMTGYGRIRAWESLSYAIACLVFGAALERIGVGWSMPIYGVACVAVLAWSLTLQRDTPRRLSGHGRLGAVGAVFREAPRFWGFLAATLLVWIGFNAAWNFIALKISDEGGGPLLVGFGLALGGLVEVATMRVSSRLQERWGLRRVFVAGCLAYAVGFVLWGLVSEPTIVSALAVFEGLAFSLLFTTIVVVVGRLLPATLYSTGNAMAQMVGFGVAPILGAGLGGMVYQAIGPVTLYAGAAALALAGAVAGWFALSTKELSEPAAVVSEAEPGAQPEPGLVP